MNDSLIPRLEDLFREDLHVEFPSTDTDIIETGVLDSMMFVELLAAIETRFGIVIPLEDLDVDSFRSIRRISEFLAAQDVS